MFMEDNWIQDLNLLTTSGCFGFYSHAKVTQIVLIDTDTGQAWNYFTDIYFSSKVKPKKVQTHSEVRTFRLVICTPFASHLYLISTPFL